MRTSITSPTKYCNDCKQTKLKDQFTRVTNKPHRHLAFCKPCYSARSKEYVKDNSEKVKKGKKAYRLANKEKVQEYNIKYLRSRGKDWYLKKTFGITLEDYNKLVKVQNNKCALCLNSEVILESTSGKPRSLAVDHCHNTGKVRGLLCFHCNTILGKIKDSQQWLDRASIYLSGGDLFHKV